MKKVLVLLTVVSLLVPISANAQSTLVLQEKCAEAAKKFFFEFKNQYRSDPDLLPDYTCHYNKKLDRCFINIFVVTFNKDGKEENISQYLFDVFGAGQQTKTLAYGMFRKFLDKTQTPQCKVGEKICHSEAEFRALIKPYMEE